MLKGQGQGDRERKRDKTIVIGDKEKKRTYKTIEEGHIRTRKKDREAKIKIDREKKDRK